MRLLRLREGSDLSKVTQGLRGRLDILVLASLSNAPVLYHAATGDLGASRAQRGYIPYLQAEDS